jgi:hypothetical protein
MEAREIRMGNKVRWDYEIYTITAISTDVVDITRFGIAMSINIKSIKPIPLTEEWLVKFGFKNKTVLEFIDRYFIDEFSVDYNRTHKYYHFNVGYEFNVEIDHIHELQNLHFSLTGEELC